MGKYKYICLHCLDTPPDRYIDKATLDTWHQGPKDLKDGSVKYKGKLYPDRNSLPDEKISGVPIIKLHGRGWDRDGYEKIYHHDGTVSIITEVDDDDWITNNEMTWGAAGINANTKHWALQGGWLKLAKGWKKSGTFDFFDLYSDALFTKLEFDLKEELGKHPHVQVLGHYHVPGAGKTCPNIDVPKTLKLMSIPSTNIYTP